MRKSCFVFRQNVQKELKVIMAEIFKKDSYNPQSIEKKWQDFWEKEKIFAAENDSKKQKFYCLDMFPYH